MSVIVRVLGSNHMELYCKGAPEKIATLCKKDSCKFSHGSATSSSRTLDLIECFSGSNPECYHANRLLIQGCFHLGLRLSSTWRKTPNYGWQMKISAETAVDHAKTYWLAPNLLYPSAMSPFYKYIMYPRRIFHKRRCLRTSAHGARWSTVSVTPENKLNQSINH